MITGYRRLDTAWQAIFDHNNIHSHNFEKSPFYLSANQIKQATSHFTDTGQREVRILCKQDERNGRPLIFQQHGLFILPVRNGEYALIKGEGYVDIPLITTDHVIYDPELHFNLVTSLVGDSEMQHLDYAYATSIVRSFMEDDSLVLTIRGRKYTPEFDFFVGEHKITAKSVQTEVDAGYEGESQVVLIEAKRSTTNTIIRQLYYPFRQWKHHVDSHSADKNVSTVFFERRGREYHFWQFAFQDISDYNSIELVKSKRFRLPPNR